MDYGIRGYDNWKLQAPPDGPEPCEHCEDGKCPACNGSGDDALCWGPCPVCNGSRKCVDCDGEGYPIKPERDDYEP